MRHAILLAVLGSLSAVSYAEDRINWIEYDGFSTWELNDSVIVHFEVDVAGEYEMTVSQDPDIGFDFYPPGLQYFASGQSHYSIPVYAIPSLNYRTELGFVLKNSVGSSLHEYYQFVNVEEPLAITPSSPENLAHRFAPLLRYDSDEIFHVHDIDILLRCGQIVDENEDIVCPKPITEHLLSRYASSKHRIDVTPNDYENLENALCDSVFTTLYCNVRWDHEFIVLVYWLFHLHDNGLALKNGIGWHECDWEGMVVILSPHEVPLFCGYSQHYDGEIKLYKHAETMGNHPVGYVALYKHATYYTVQGKSEEDNEKIDPCDGLGKWILPEGVAVAHPDTEYWDSIAVLQGLDSFDENCWTVFSGKFGNDHSIWSSNPPAPAFHEDKRWIHPVEWTRDLNSRLVCAVSGVSPATDDDSATIRLEDQAVFYGNNSATLNPDGMLNYKWRFGNGDSTDWITATSTEYSYAQEGEYDVVLVVKDTDPGEEDVDSMVVTVVSVGVAEGTSRPGDYLSVNPNPFTHNVVVEFGVHSSQPEADEPLAQEFVDEKPSTLKIYDLAGRIVRTLNLCNLSKSVKSPPAPDQREGGQVCPGMERTIPAQVFRPVSTSARLGPGTVSKYVLHSS